MSVEEVSALLQDMILTSLLVSSPFLAAALVLGLSISIVQAATQINEQTLTFVPKIIIVLGTFGVLFPWTMRSIIAFAERVMRIVAQQGVP